MKNHGRIDCHSRPGRPIAARYCGHLRPWLHRLPSQDRQPRQAAESALSIPMPVKTLKRGEAEPEGLTFCRFSQSRGYSQKPFLQWHSQACRLTARGRGSPRRPAHRVEPEVDFLSRCFVKKKKCAKFPPNFPGPAGGES
jgi:hypothetical protein